MASGVSSPPASAQSAVSAASRPDEPRFPILVVVGVGLIGGSFALALREAGAVGRVVGVGRSRASIDEALRLGVIDEVLELEAAAAVADLVFVATPVGQMEPILARMATHLRPGALVTDGGSTKCDVVAAATRALGPRVAQFIPGHPVAGAEKSGAAAAQLGLYRNRRVVLTPLAENAPADVARVEAAWRACGAIVSHMTAERHDRVLATISHLPHVLAYALVEDIVADPDAQTLWQFAAGGFRDFSRIASSHPEMWRDICLANRDALLERIDGYAATLDRLRSLIESGDGDGLDAVFRRARNERNRWLEQFEARQRVPAPLASADGGGQ
jgi:prephenate dehydrogenase